MTHSVYKKHKNRKENIFLQFSRVFHLMDAQKYIASVLQAKDEKRTRAKTITSEKYGETQIRRLETDNRVSS